MKELSSFYPAPQYQEQVHYNTVFPEPVQDTVITMRLATVICEKHITNMYTHIICTVCMRVLHVLCVYRCIIWDLYHGAWADQSVPLWYN